MILHPYKCTTFYTVFRLFLVRTVKHALNTFKAENRLFHEHAEPQLTKVRSYKTRPARDQRTLGWKWSISGHSF